eukprot:s1390_g9.t1
MGTLKQDDDECAEQSCEAAILRASSYRQNLCFDPIVLSFPSFGNFRHPPRLGFPAVAQRQLRAAVFSERPCRSDLSTAAGPVSGVRLDSFPNAFCALPGDSKAAGSVTANAKKQRDSIFILPPKKKQTRAFLERDVEFSDSNLLKKHQSQLYVDSQQRDLPKHRPLGPLSFFGRSLTLLISCHVDVVAGAHGAHLGRREAGVRHDLQLYNASRVEDQSGNSLRLHRWDLQPPIQ